MHTVLLMRLKPGALPEYRERHRAVWPELEAEFAAAGIHRVEIFEAGGILVLLSEVSDEAAWSRLWATPVHRRWALVMDALLESDAGGSIASAAMTQLYRYPHG